MRRFPVDDQEESSYHLININESEGRPGDHFQEQAGCIEGCTWATCCLDHGRGSPPVGHRGVTDPNIRYFTRVTGWTMKLSPNAKVEVEGHVELAEALEAARGIIRMGDGEHVKVQHLVEMRVPMTWQGNHLPDFVEKGPNFIKVEHDDEAGCIRLYDIYGLYANTYDFDEHMPKEGMNKGVKAIGMSNARVAAVRTAKYLAEQNNIEWGSNW